MWLPGLFNNKLCFLVAPISPKVQLYTYSVEDNQGISYFFLINKTYSECGMGKEFDGGFKGSLFGLLAE